MTPETLAEIRMLCDDVVKSSRSSRAAYLLLVLLRAYDTLSVSHKRLYAESVASPTTGCCVECGAGVDVELLDIVVNGRDVYRVAPRCSCNAPIHLWGRNIPGAPAMSRRHDDRHETRGESTCDT